MNTHDIEKTREALIRQWNRSYRKPWILRQLCSQPGQIILLGVLGSMVLGAIPILYGLSFNQVSASGEPTQVGVWSVLGTKD